MKKNTLIVATLVSALALSPAVFAKKEQGIKFDMKNAKCEEITKLDEESAAVILMWIDGYLSGVTGDTTFDSAQLEKFAHSLGEFCAKSPKTKVLDASKELGIEGEEEEEGEEDKAK